MNQIYNKDNKELARNLRKEMTPWERKLWYQFLKGYSYRFYRQRPVGNYILDFYNSKCKLCVELDGSQHYSGDGVVYDEQRTSFLNEMGITVLRFSNYDIDRNFEAVCVSIDDKIKELSGAGKSGENCADPSVS